ncbi:MAG TPA: endonuclease/exonuclease/phosphatase family protein [Chthoniobacterales bacterium]|nr:endonuclease/exonuclease/phosphatase family protein [Chthoniobacterales bacterium]
MTEIDPVTSKTDQNLRVASYNVHGCRGTDGKRSEKRIAEVIGMLDVDVIGLQELDLNRRRSARVDQTALIAGQLGWHFHFHPALRIGDEQYGNAILSRYPLRVRQAKELRSVTTRWCPETRAALWVEIETPRGLLHVINTHLGLGRHERLMQADLLAGSEWLGQLGKETPIVLTGDLNSLPGSPAFRRLAEKLRDIRSLVSPRPRLRTFPTRYPLLAVDHIFVNDRLQVNRVRVVRNAQTRIASDHFPLVADLRWV